MADNQPQTQQPPPFEQSPEAQEYIDKLQQNRVELPADANMLEHQSLKNLQDASQRRRELVTMLNDNEKQVEALKRRQEGIKQDLDTAAGQMSAYAQLLVAAEGARRAGVRRAGGDTSAPIPQPRPEGPPPTGGEYIEPKEISASELPPGAPFVPKAVSPPDTSEAKDQPQPN